MHLVDALEDLDDVQDVFTNVDIPPRSSPSSRPPTPDGAPPRPTRPFRHPRCNAGFVFVPTWIYPGGYS